jgi:hypothetical protein
MLHSSSGLKWNSVGAVCCLCANISEEHAASIFRLKWSPEYGGSILTVYQRFGGEKYVDL